MTGAKIGVTCCDRNSEVSYLLEAIEVKSIVVTGVASLLVGAAVVILCKFEMVSVIATVYRI